MNKIAGNNILTIGCDYKPPKGGIAQVIYTYEKEVFQTFHFISNSCEGNIFRKCTKALWAYLKTLLLLLLHREIDIVHIHTASYNSFNRSSYFVSLSKFLRRKVILHIHGGGFKEFYQVTPKRVLTILQRCDVIVALTEQWKCFYDYIGCKNVKVVNNIIPSPIVPESKVVKDIIHILYLGKICDPKGVFDLIQVICENIDVFRGKILLHIGGNGETERLTKTIRDNHIGDVVHFEGWVSGENKVKLLNLSNLFVLPSYTEGLPISILEALSYKTPVIATNVGGIPEIINNKNGWLFTPGDKDALLNILKQIVSDSSILREREREAILSVQKNLPSSIIQSLQDIYSEL